ncbi:MAG: hypothetical protein R3F19_02845 [Verrucomicrobiales bacterium]
MPVPITGRPTDEIGPPPLALSVGDLVIPEEAAPVAFWATDPENRHAHGCDSRWRWWRPGRNRRLFQNHRHGLDLAERLLRWFQFSGVVAPGLLRKTGGPDHGW